MIVAKHDSMLLPSMKNLRQNSGSITKDNSPCSLRTENMIVTAFNLKDMMPMTETASKGILHETSYIEGEASTKSLILNRMKREKEERSKLKRNNISKAIINRKTPFEPEDPQSAFFNIQVETKNLVLQNFIKGDGIFLKHQNAGA